MAATPRRPATWRGRAPRPDAGKRNRRGRSSGRVLVIGGCRDHQQDDRTGGSSDVGHGRARVHSCAPPGARRERDAGAPSAPASAHLCRRRRRRGCPPSCNRQLATVAACPRAFLKRTTGGHRGRQGGRRAALAVDPQRAPQSRPDDRTPAPFVGGLLVHRRLDDPGCAVEHRVGLAGQRLDDGGKFGRTDLRTREGLANVGQFLDAHAQRGSQLVELSPGSGCARHARCGRRPAWPCRPAPPAWSAWLSGRLRKRVGDRHWFEVRERLVVADVLRVGVAQAAVPAAAPAQDLVRARDGADVAEA